MRSSSARSPGSSRRPSSSPGRAPTPEARRISPTTERRASSERNAGIIAEFFANHGKVGGPFEGKPVFLPHHKGAHIRIERVDPLMYQKLHDGDAVFASTGGAPHNPDWFYNLRANPAASGERAPVWERPRREWPQFAGYEEKTRAIPVAILRPTS